MQHCMFHNIAPLSHSLYNNYPIYNIEQVINVPSLSIPLEEATMNLSGDLAGQINSYESSEFKRRVQAH